MVWMKGRGWGGAGGSMVLWEASRPRGTPYWKHGEHVGASADGAARGPEKKEAVGNRKGRGTNRTCGLLSAAA